MKTYDRDIDYLGEIGRILRDLTGYSTLAYELIQNADDDLAASHLVFNVCNEALIVSHDGTFSDCGEQDEPPNRCPAYLETGDRCDLHSFRRVGGANKAQREDTTGAFGIGFTAVYQVTDRPELATAGHHWHIDETAVRSEGIRACSVSECELCTSSQEGTTLRLPWATDGSSAFRRETKSQPVPKDVQHLLSAELIEAVPLALIFLRRLTSVEVRVDGELRYRASRERQDDTLTIRVEKGLETTAESFVLLGGEFPLAARALRDKYQGLIEPSRSDKVQIAVPLEQPQGPGRYFAGLPTDDPTELPVHISGDFYPNSERKHLVREAFRGEWNDAALDCAARTLAGGLLQLPERAQVSTIWGLLLAAYQLTRLGEANGGGRYWTELVDAARDAPILLTASGAWVSPNEAYYLQEAGEQRNAAGLAMLGLKIAADDVADVIRRGLKATELGLKQLTSGHLGSEMRQLGHVSEVALNELPEPLRDTTCQSALLSEVEILVARERADVLHDSALADAAVLPCTDGNWRSVLSVFPDVPPQLAFLETEGIIPVIDYLAMPGAKSSELFKTCTPLDASDLIRFLSATDEELLSELWRVPDRHRQVLLALSHQRQDIDEAERVLLAKLPVFPTAKGLAPIGDLRLPASDFVDELGLAGVVDLTGIQEVRPLLTLLDVETLDFETYIAKAVPQAAANEVHTKDPETWSRLLEMLWRSASRIVDNKSMLHALTRCPVVPTSETGPPFVLPTEAYFRTEWVTGCLGGLYPTAYLPDGAREAAKQLLGKLGVAEEPRPPHIFTVLDTLKPHSGRQEARTVVTLILAWLGQRPEMRERPARLGDFQPLATRSWLPAEGDKSRWYKPEQLYTAFAKPLVESVGPFLDVSVQTQRQIASLIDTLGVRNDPRTSAIVQHLSNFAKAGRPVSRRVYQTLNDRAGDGAEVTAIAGLRKAKCLLPEDGTYVSPAHVFASDNPFGNRRVVLGEGFPYAALLKAMRVKSTPDHEDAIELLLELAGEYETTGTPLATDDQAAVRAAWRILQRQLEAGVVDNVRLHSAFERRTCILLDDGRLASPGTVYIEDSPAIARSIARDADVWLIPRNDQMWKAHQAAGIVDLGSDAVPLEVEISGIVAAPELRDRWLDLWPALARVIHASCDVPIDEACRRLTGLEVSWVDELAIQYRLRRYPRLVNPVLHPGAALLGTDSSPHLYVHSESRGKHDLPRELARHLVAQSWLGGVIPALAAVLASESTDEAHKALDGFDVPRLATSIGESTAHSAVLVDLAGTDEDLPQPARFKDGGVIDREGEDTMPLDAAAARLEDEAPQPRSGSNEPPQPNSGLGEGDQSGTGSGRDGTSAAANAATAAIPPGTNGGQGEVPPVPSRTSASSSRSSGQLRSYVVHETRTVNRSDSEDDPRSAVDEAGVALVVTFEEGQGRSPEVKPHHNKGYDILSRGGSGQQDRTIEVKSVRGEWGARGAAMSAAQFRHATGLGDRYWLYIVEFATDPERARLWRIQDPANRVQQYFFDDGWAAVALQDDVGAKDAIELPALLLEPGPGRLPVFDLSSGLAEPAGFVDIADADVSEAQFAVQIRTRALADECQVGALALVEPVSSQPEEGEVVLARLDDPDPDTGLLLVTRTWWEEDGAVTLGGGNGVVPLVLHDRPVVVGKIIRELRD